MSEDDDVGFMSTSSDIANYYNILNHEMGHGKTALFVLFLVLLVIVLYLTMSSPVMYFQGTLGS